MQEEVTNKTVALCIRTTKLTADVLKSAMRAYLRSHSQKSNEKKQAKILKKQEAERLAAYREKKNRQHKAWYERQKAAQPPKPRTLKELAAALDAGQPLTPEETERLEASRSRKKNAYQELKAQAETDPVAAAELARRRAYHSEATKKSRQKMYEEAAAGNPEAQARYENFLAARRENYHKKKQDEKGEQIA